MGGDFAVVGHRPSLSFAAVVANRHDEEDGRFAKLREAMVERQLCGRGIRDERLLAAFAEIPREAFVGPELAHEAYSDGPLPIGCGQTISQPYIVALMIEAAGVTADDRVLEVGAGSGYAAAILARVADSVVAIERIAELASEARARLERLGLGNVRLVEGDGSLGWPEAAPYDAILAAASGSHVPDPLVAQLRPGGRLVMPIGLPSGVQQLVKVMRLADGSVKREELGAVRFVPLIGEEGWSDG